MEDQKNIQTDSMPAANAGKVLEDIEQKAKSSTDLKTTIAGTIASVATGLLGVPGPHTAIAGIVAAVAGSLWAYWSKDRK